MVVAVVASKRAGGRASERAFLAGWFGESTSQPGNSASSGGPVFAGTLEPSRAGERATLGVLPPSAAGD